MLLVSGCIFIRRVRVMKGIREIAITDMPEVPSVMSRVTRQKPV